MAYQVKGIKHDHEILRETADRIKEALLAGDQTEIFRTIETFYQELEIHFKEEEADTGWLAEVEKRTPRMLSVMDDLRADHKKLLQGLKEICQSESQDPSAVVKLVEASIDMFERHESAEDKIIDEMFYRDVGYPA